MKRNFQKTSKDQGDSGSDVRKGQYSKDTLTNEMFELAKEFYASALKMPKPSFKAIPQVRLEKGFRNSKNAMKQQEIVFLSPLGKNIIEANTPGLSEGWTLKVDDKPLRGEEWLQEQVVKQLESLNGPERTEYDETQPLDSVDHYNVDCWRNKKRIQRQIQPGQAEGRAEKARMFATPIDGWHFFKIMEESPQFRLAMRYVYDYFPSVSADEEFTDSAQPFENHHSTVSAPFWEYDQNETPDGETYAQVCIDMAKKIRSLEEAWEFNLNTYYGRDQIKDRLITAISRVLAVYLNRIQHPEIEALKRVGPFAGLNDDLYLKRVMIEMMQFCLRHDYRCANFDQKAFDMHINPALLAVAGAIRAMKARGALAKRLVKLRTMINIRSWVVNGLTGKIEEIFGRMFSGLGDTNTGDGVVESTLFPTCLMYQDPRYSRDILGGTPYPFLVMGDDTLAIYRVLNKAKLVEDMAKFDMELHPDKGEYGVFFLQYRLFKQDGEYIMTYPWTRVLGSMIYLERAKGLGKAGWLLAQYQQLFKLIEYPPAMDAIIRICYPYDQLKFGKDLSVQEIKDMVAEEDRKAAEEQKNSKRYSSTAEKLYDGDPSKQRQFDADGGISDDYLNLIHSAVKASIERCGYRL